MTATDINRLISLLEQYEGKGIIVKFLKRGAYSFMLRGICRLRAYDSGTHYIRLWNSTTGFESNITLKSIAGTELVTLSDGEKMFMVTVEL